ncbi:hypothetical protein I3843_11G201500 [Carya illinoinensis]|uniref:Uncharacterized protein n=1 Tax=Carya illinoinensis TaxID=32201 RepID=A0A8T1P6J6_CARIL|nr:protein YELLOW LEAF 1, choloroplastic-like isoform X1 [Carya illinoinensis]KAG6637848.1 hypothetical protein CIPAW_11G206900 [Carya illinoinensis]KAG6690038.1 hypothetical protein I3842_11G203700 [Carya illinoinensis]KAG7957957.1 hypothetical protein I3843_11G201500 [Carya illinoinensis]
MLTANIFATSNQFPLVKREGQCRGHTKLTGSNQVKTFFVPFQEFSGKTRTLEIVRAGPPGLGAQILPIDRRGPTIHSTRTQSASLLCHSSLNARCGAEQTQTVTREAPTITHVPGKEKSPQLDDGGSGFPPRDDGDGGGGGGGGGGNWSGGFFFFGFLAFLGFLKDKESEGAYRDERR